MFKNLNNYVINTNVKFVLHIKENMLLYLVVILFIVNNVNL